ncbi:MAG: glycerate kinase [Bacillota bacterium]
MKIVIALDSFKGSLSSAEAAAAAEEGIEKAFRNRRVEVIKVPLADGGEGTVEALTVATGGKILCTTVTGPLGNTVDAFYGILGDGKTAVIEMAAASGLYLISKEERNPLKTTTYGTGDLIKEALEQGCREFIIGIGGSATNDGGAGMLQALGVRLLDEHGKDIARGGAALKQLNRIDISNLDPRIKETKITVACDVDNPLCGEKGASAVYGPQKGATEQMVKILDEALAHFAKVIRRDLGKDILHVPGAGAAGGLGGGLMAFLEAGLQPGIDLVIEKAQLKEKMKGADFVLTGEGKIDSQTVFGKAPIGVAKAAKECNIPVIGIAGAITDDGSIVHEHGIHALFSIMQYPMDVEHAMEKERAGFFVEKTVEEIFRLIAVSVGKPMAKLNTMGGMKR